MTATLPPLPSWFVPGARVIVAASSAGTARERVYGGEVLRVLKTKVVLLVATPSGNAERSYGRPEWREGTDYVVTASGSGWDRNLASLYRQGSPTADRLVAEKNLRRSGASFERLSERLVKAATEGDVDTVRILAEDVREAAERLSRLASEVEGVRTAEQEAKA